MENRVKQEESISLVRHCFIANLTTTSSAVRGCRWLVWGQEIPQLHSCLCGTCARSVCSCSFSAAMQKCQEQIRRVLWCTWISMTSFDPSLSRTLALSSPLTQSQHEAALSLSQTWGGTSRRFEKPVHRSNLRGGYNVAAGMLTGPELKALHSALLLHTEHVKCAFDTTFCHSECTDSAKRKEKSVSPTHKNI